MTVLTNTQSATLFVIVVLAIWKLIDLGVVAIRRLVPGRPWFPVEEENVIRARENRLRRAGICDACYGRGYYDNPPWGITPCDECNGLGNVKCKTR